MNADELLKELVEALDNAFISSWQSTHYWQQQLDAAREYLKLKHAALSSLEVIGKGEKE